MAIDDDHVPSPCVRLCTLDDDDVCVGCYRTLDEIKAWGGLDSEGRRAVLAATERRRPARRGISCR
ncbi:DUF1289 domain-containing protein [Azospirillum thermophilum]|uniref:DUF1289 domain-containing protein n=1 Tax=Azospirillum thermophilum TaxID=2202148 RepID=A0A2S2CNA3_9PROT|nr:DUF1289 domain-containing protein [Azospirillum thermophilum]AWK85919.1 DUF1289 domain-containing protein [Azospirillum thermophilum]